MRTTRFLVSTSMIAALGLAACGGENGENGGAVAEELHVAYNVQPPTLDPYVTTAHATRIIARTFYEPLITLDAEGEVQPVLAEDFEVSDDGLTITFNLRDDVVFHNGEEMTEEDVIASFERWRELSTIGPNYFGDADFESPEDGVFTIEMPAPMFFAPTLIADPQIMPHIMPASVIEGAGEDGVEEHIGTGPYEMGEWATDQHIRLDRFEDYSSPQGEPSGMAGEKTAYFDEIFINFVQDSSTRVSGLQSGEYDLGIPVPWDNAEAIEEDENIETVLGESGIVFAVFNKDEGVMADLEMRQAVIAAMNPEDSLLSAYGDEEFFNVNSGIMPEGHQWFVETNDEFDALYEQSDVDLAQELMDEAGYDGEEIRILTTRDYEDHYDNAVVLQQQLEDAGMNTDLIVVDWPTHTELREDPSEFEIATTDISNWPSVPATWHFFTDGWWGAGEHEGIQQASEAVINAEDEDEAAAALEDLQDAYYDYIPIAKFGDRFTPSGLNSEYTGYEYVTGVGEIFHHVRPAD